MYGSVNKTSCLPLEVMQWAGLNSTNPYVFLANHTGDMVSLAALNDQGYSFQRIAGLIEAGAIEAAETSYIQRYGDDSEVG